MHNSYRYIAGMLAVLVITTTSVKAAAGPDTTTPAIKAEFRKLCSKRDHLLRTLVKLDNKAADMVAEGKDPIEINAEQMAAQDEIDLVQLKLESMSIRHDLVLPKPRSHEDYQDGDRELRHKVRAMFLTGHERTSRVMLQRTRIILARIDFTDFNEN